MILERRFPKPKVGRSSRLGTAKKFQLNLVAYCLTRENADNAGIKACMAILSFIDAGQVVQNLEIFGPHSLSGSVAA